jgi:hypothetical protein
MNRYHFTLGCLRSTSTLQTIKHRWSSWERCWCHNRGDRRRRRRRRKRRGNSWRREKRFWTNRGWGCTSFLYSLVSRFQHFSKTFSTSLCSLVWRWAVSAAAWGRRSVAALAVATRSLGRGGSLAVWVGIQWRKRHGCRERVL